MGKIESYEDLEVWRLGIDVVEDIYKATSQFPSEEVYGLTSQLRRAAVSIPSNIAEGWGRGRGKDFRRFLFIARSSAYEVKTQLLVSNRIGHLTDEDFARITARLDQLGRMLHGLIKTLNK